MKKLISIFFVISSFAFSQGYDFQQLCLDCAEANGFYCGDDPSNWTQYAPMGCVQSGWLNDGWEDCIDASDENGAEPTSPEDCGPPPPPPCDTVFIEVPFIEYIYETDTLEVPFYIYETIIQLDTVIETEYITQIVVDTIEIETFVPEYIYVVDTVMVYEDVLDTLIIEVPVVEYVDTIIYDTITEIEYVEFFVTDTVIEYVEIIETEYIDCNTGLPCNSGMQEIIEKSTNTGLIYNMQGQAIRKPEGIYIEGGKVKYKIN